MTEESTAKYKALVAKHGLTGPLPLLERLDAVYMLMEEYGGVMHDRGLLLDKKDAEIADLKSALAIEMDNALSTSKILSTAIGKADALLDAEQITKGPLSARVEVFIGRLNTTRQVVTDVIRELPGYGDDNLPVAAHVRRLREERAELHEDRGRALRIAYELTLDCQTMEEAARALVELVMKTRAERDTANHAVGQAMQQREEDRHVAGSARLAAKQAHDEALRKYERAIDCHKEPAGCGGCVTCLNRKLDAVEAERDVATAQVRKLMGPSNRGESTVESTVESMDNPGHGCGGKFAPNDPGGTLSADPAADGKLDHLALSIAAIFTECDIDTATRRCKARLRELVAETKAAATGRPKSKVGKTRPLVKPVCIICGRNEDDDCHMDGTNGPDDAHEFRAPCPEDPELKLLTICADGLCSHSTEAECWAAAKTAAKFPQRPG